MNSESVFLLEDGSRVSGHVSGGGKDLRPPKHDGMGNTWSEKITHGKDSSSVPGGCTGTGDQDELGESISRPGWEAR